MGTHERIGSSSSRTSEDSPNSPNRSSGVRSSMEFCPPFSSLLEELYEETRTTVFSYESTISTNYTMSNLAGPGRNLGNLYSWAGSSLERRLGKVVNRAAMREYDEAVRRLRMYSFLDKIFAGEDPNLHQGACEVLLICARSDDLSIQVEAFERIVWNFVWWTSKLRAAFTSVFKRRKEVSDIVTFSWRRPGIEYSFKWLLPYKQASLCLSSHLDSTIELAAQLNKARYRDLKFSHFEGLLLGCRNSVDTLFVTKFIDFHFNGKGIEGYLRRKGFNDTAIGNFAIALVNQWELCFSRRNPSGPVLGPLKTTLHLLDGVLRSIRNTEIDVLNELSEHVAILSLWKSVFQLHYFLRSSGRCAEDWERVYPFFTNAWKILCTDYLPNSEHSKLRQSLLSLDDIHGPAMFKRFPPLERSLINREEKVKTISASQ
ncbi:hypothetical protein SCHPADRAFT_318584 [Schizopora paradoxa]|uniref:Uncharacterized protein n=1 Tax=Schizopora paradoxa TaxID=27342 RepID=A0A0H2RR03_9AGAM|nr:hypothetical protein SCHPADRAFT_318584 [Schizopora paradoxa]